MISFRGFLTERIRTREQALKLGEYLTKRFRRSNPNRPDIFPKFHIGKAYAAEYDDDNDDKHDTKAFSSAYTNAHNIFRKRKKNVTDVNIGDLLKHNAQKVEFNKSYTETIKDKDKRPINVAISRRTGNMFVVDGFHRIAWRMLQGHKTISTNLQPVGRKKK